MSSLYDELAEKVRQDPRLTKRGGARVDLSVLLFNAADPIRELWMAADAQVRAGGAPTQDLEDAVDALRPIFGNRDA